MSASGGAVTGIKGFVSEFESSPEALKASLGEGQKIHKRFLARFPREKLKETLTLRKYAIGRGDADTFCYWVERVTRPLGSILGSPSDKFKVYFSKKEQRYRWVKGFTTAQAAFRKTKSEILNLLNAAENDDLQAIKNNHFFRNSHMYRGKLLYLYFPDKFLNVFSEDDIDYFLDRLGIEYGEKDHVLDKQMKLLEYRNNAVSVKSWPNLKFGLFLYNKFEPPSRRARKSSSKKRRATQTTKDLLREERAYVLPPPEEANLTEVDLDEIPEVSGKSGRGKGGRRKVNYLVEALRNQKLGDQAEEIVLLYERQLLTRNKRKDLARKVKRVSVDDDNLGYDILSYSVDGDPKYIEVKATKLGVDQSTPFYLTDRQRQTMVEKGKQYFIYRVFAAHTKNPQLLKIKSDLLKKRFRMETHVWQISVR